LGRAVEPGESPVLSSDKALRAFLIHLAEETRVSERSARLYLAHLQRFAVWLAEQHEADLIGATSHDMRAYRGQLTGRGQGGRWVSSTPTAGGPCSPRPTQWRRSGF
jgi:site-specific recombinase XerD